MVSVWLYWALFVWLAWRGRQWLWLAASLAAAVAGGLGWLFLSSSDPHLLSYLTPWLRLSPLYYPQWCVLAGALVAFRRHWRRLSPRLIWVFQGDAGCALFAASLLANSVATLCLLLLALGYYPHGLTPYLLPALLQLYVLDPTPWLYLQAVLAAVFFLHRRLQRETVCWFSLKQWQSGFLLAFGVQGVLVLADLWRIRY